MILLLFSIATAEPLMSFLKQGDPAPFDGRILNDEAIATILAEKEFSVEQCEIQQSLDYSLKLTEKQLKIDYLEAEKATLINRQESLLKIRDEEIKVLRYQSKPQRAMWAFFGGFAIGTSASLATYYAVRSIE